MSLCVSSSDLERARALARRLAGAGNAPPAAAARGAGAVGARFEARRVDARPEQTTGGLGAWDAHLAFCRSLAPVDALLVTDHDGLVVARAGDFHGHDVDGVAARLVGALEQGELLAALARPAADGAPGDAAARGDAACVSIEWDGLILGGWRVVSGEASFVVGLLGRERVAPAARRAVSARIRAAASAASV